MEFSSEGDEEADIMSRMLAEMTQKRFQIKMSPTGKILETKNVDIIFKSMADGFPELSEEQKAQIITQLKQKWIQHYRVQSTGR